jgi:hypothetical protein
MSPVNAVRGEDRLEDGAGVLLKPRGEGDVDLVGSLRLDGRLYQLRAWIIEHTDSPPTIRIQAQRLRQ